MPHRTFFRVTRLFFLSLLIVTLSPPVIHAASAKASVPPLVRQAGDDLARLFHETLTMEDAAGLIRRSGSTYDAKNLIPSRNLLECRRGRALSVLLGMYRADAAYALVFGHSAHAPLREGLEKLALPEGMTEGLLRGWDVEGKTDSGKSRVVGLRARQELEQAAHSLQTFGQVRVLVDILLGVLLENTYLVCESILQLSPEAQTGVAMEPALDDAILRLDLLRKLLLNWAKDPLLVKELGLHSEINLLDRLQADMEMLRGQPSYPLVQRILEAVLELRSELVIPCRADPKPGPGTEHILQRREDLFKPRNFFQ